MYSIEFSETAEKQFNKLPKDIQIRIVSSLERIRIRPQKHVLRLVGSPYFRLRVGDYRIILDIRDDKLIILVIVVGHRRNIYGQ
ncbi:MAG TPA: type II toxin-antitoxin system RelE/ParE family toxin [Candidatus Nanoarchaeia archaeon]|nr:type II toxin-antitoxin system RelE/ParE family toxin [Candidatus Nanoarchaeia archaeon]